MTAKDHQYDPDIAALPTRRRDAARQLLHIDQLRESFSLSAQPSLRNASLAGFQAALTAAIALPIVHVSPWSHLIGYAALGSLMALFGRFAPPKQRGAIVLQCAFWQTLSVVLMSTVVWLGAPIALQLLLLAVFGGIFFFVSTVGKFGPPGALIFIFAASAAMGHVDTWTQIVERGAATAIVSLLAYLVCLAMEPLRHHPLLPPEPTPAMRSLLIASSRLAVGAGLAAFAAYAAGASFPAWAAMGTVAVMQGTQLHINMNRALQRMAGNVIGAIFVWLVLSAAPSLWTIIVLLVLLQACTEIVIGSNYALGQIFVTPMALLMSYLAAPGIAGVGMAPERVLDTLLGISIGMILAIVASTIDDRVFLAKRKKTT